MCIDPASAVTVTRVLTYSARALQAHGYRVVYTPLKLLVPG
eukprot:COSAG02_NODE_51495_length_313_cov_2.397196_1_plen_40_part_10